MIWRLALSNFANRRIRVALTVAAIALSVSLVIAVTSGYASIEAAAFKFLSQYVGTSDVQITRANDPRGGISESLIDELRRDPLVERIDGRMELGNLLQSEAPGNVNQNDDGLKPRAMGGRHAQVIGLDRPGDRRVDTMRMIKGAWFETDHEPVAVIDQSVAETLNVKVGDSFSLPGPTSSLSLRVAGIVHKPALLAAHIQTIYVPLKTAQRFFGYEGQVTRVLIDLKDGADAESIVAKWKESFAASDRNLRFRLAHESRNEMAKNLQGLHVLSYLGGTVSMLAAMFIVFSALSMGVAERQRTLAMLRAVGAYRAQVAKLVVVEGLLLAGAGVAIGVPLGLAFITALASVPKFAPFFSAGVTISAGGLLYGAGGSMLAALVASFLPAWSAMRVSPLEAMTPLATPGSSRAAWISAAIGVLLISIDPFLFFGPVESIVSAFGAADSRDVARAVRFYLHFVLGVPGIMIGFFLLAPLFVQIVERTLGPIVSSIFGLRFTLLRQQLSGGLWRAAGTCAALMVGLAILTVMQTQGTTMIGSWRLPDKFPDVFIARQSGLTETDLAELSRVEGIKDVMPMAIASPEFGTKMFALAMAAVMPDATMFIGVDPDKAFNPDNPDRMMELEFRVGDAKSAGEMLELGDHLIVTDEFRQLKGLTVGDKLPLETNQGVVEFTIAGVVWSPGIDVMVSMYDLSRQFDQRTAATVFGSLEDAKKYFGVERYYIIAANLNYFVEKEKMLEKTEATLALKGLKVGDVRQIKHAIQSGFTNLLLLASTVAFAAMAVASLGVTNTIMASIRSRRWQLGVLRSIGVTRSQLLRLILAEAVLLGLVGCALGLTAGFEMAVNAKALSHSTIGYSPPMIIPWGIITLGTGIIMAISILASLWPAISVARTEPLTLLQAGRSSA